MEGFQPEYILRLLAAVAFGGLIGLERELQDKPVGLRSNILICLGAALFTLLAGVLTAERGDPTRVAGQIVTGIGFLGGGAILRQGDRIQGITTAATIWLVASIGVGAGCGQYPIAAAGTGLALVVLLGFRRLERFVEGIFDARTYCVTFLPDAAEAGLRAAEEAIRESGLRASERHVDVVEGRRRHTYRITGRLVRHAGLADRLAALPGTWELKIV